MGGQISQGTGDGNLQAQNPLSSLIQQSPILKALQSVAGQQPSQDQPPQPQTPQVSPTTSPVDVAPTPNTDRTASYRQGIQKIESGGRYDIVGPATRGDRPIGAYQIMSSNVGPWTKEVLGKAMTPEEFRADPGAQDKVFDAKFGDYVNKFGEEGAAQAWLGGPGSVGKTDRKDVLGTSVGSYGQQFMNNISGTARPQTQLASADLDPHQRVMMTIMGQKAENAAQADGTTGSTPDDRVAQAAGLAPAGPSSRQLFNQKQMASQPDMNFPQANAGQPAQDLGADVVSQAQVAGQQRLAAGAVNPKAQQRKQALEARVRNQKASV